MESIKKVFSPEKYAKLERLAVLDDRYQPYLFLLDLCAYVLLAVSYGISLAPLEDISDLAHFNFIALDMAALEIGRALTRIWPIDPQGRLLAYIESHDYRLTDGYAERKIRIIEAGKYQLLLRVSQRIAERRMS